MVYSLVGTCKFRDVNPMEWLMNVFQRIPTHPSEDIAALLPYHRKQARQAHKGKAIELAGHRIVHSSSNHYIGNYIRE